MVCLYKPWLQPRIMCLEGLRSFLERGNCREKSEQVVSGPEVPQRRLLASYHGRQEPVPTERRCAYCRFYW
ncbi:uncharacterized protein DS421_20g699810 [Arachis hypogaea]|nr:uncharacterized protein DS421_20g699810 [Arachis hypogaea]